MDFYSDTIRQAWSSTRDPAQVFILLQTLYEAFDNIAKRRKVFKVETVGSLDFKGALISFGVSDL